MSTSAASDVIESQPTAVPVSKPQRLLSLDVLRGMDIALMIAVNNNGEHAYWPFRHSAWNGCTPTDLVFPTFLFLMGTSVVLSFQKRLTSGCSKASLALHILRRFVVLFAFGLVVNGFPYFPLHTLRIYGVLQRIALCFLFAGLLQLWTRSARSKVAVLVVSLVGYWVLMRYVPVPGHGVPGRDIPLLDPDQNLVAWLDRHIMPARRLYERVRDPEGLLSTLPALGTTMIGMLTGMWLRTNRSAREKCTGMLAAGVAGIIFGEIWNVSFPINKKLWTSSYVLFAAGCTLVAFAICYYLLDVKQWRRGWTYVWLVFGMNALGAYILSELLAAGVSAIRVGPRMSWEHWFYAHSFGHIQPLGVGSLLFSIFFVLVCWLPMAVLYRKRIFLKI
jgi:predicted acyltransferase